VRYNKLSSKLSFRAHYSITSLYFSSCIPWKIQTSSEVARPKLHDVGYGLQRNKLHFPITGHPKWNCTRILFLKNTHVFYRILYLADAYDARALLSLLAVAWLRFCLPEHSACLQAWAISVSRKIKTFVMSI